MGVSLTDVKGIGPATVEKLEKAGIKSVEQLATLRKEELSKILGVNLKQAGDIIQSAKQLALDQLLEVYTAEDIKRYRQENIKRIPTGCSALDSVLKGGIPTMSITVLFGEYASGKTQLCKQLVVNCLKQLGRKAAWIETEPGTFIPERLEEMASAIGYQLDLNDIIVVPARLIGTPYNLFLAYEMIEHKMQKLGLDVGLLVVDSFSAPFRKHYTGREQLPDRSAEISRHMGKLDILASKYNMAIVLTGQVGDIPDAGSQLHAVVKTGHRKNPVGGNVFLHSGTYLISLIKTKTDEWEACVFDAPDIPMTKVQFRITKEGIRDVSRTRAR